MISCFDPGTQSCQFHVTTFLGTPPGTHFELVLRDGVPIRDMEKDMEAGEGVRPPRGNIPKRGRGEGV